MERLADTQERAWQRALALQTPQEILAWAGATFGRRMTLACSFGGITGMALLHVARSVLPNLDVFTVDTGFLFPETHALRRRATDRYALELRVISPLQTPEEQAAVHGDRLWERDPDLCCALRKVEPAARALEGRDAWIVGLRRDQANTRQRVEPVAWDERFGLYKISPFWCWTEEEVADYVVANDILLNDLHKEGYPSIGCIHCTRAVVGTGDLRSGRWAGLEKTECGIHSRLTGER